MGIIDVQRRYKELGRIRIGERNEKGFPSRLETFRLTSPSLDLLKHASGRWGGVPVEWDTAPSEGTQYELVTETDELEVYVPPQNVADRQWFELYSKGGVQRRCDGTTEFRSGKACLCNPDERACSPTTHVLFMLPTIPDLGVWRLTSRGWNVASEMPSTLDLLAQLAGQDVLPAATLAIEQRTSVSEGQTHHFNVPVLRLPYALADLERRDVSVLRGGPSGRTPLPGGRPALPDGAPQVHAEVGDAPAWDGDPTSGEDVDGATSTSSSLDPTSGDDGLADAAPARPALSDPVAASPDSTSEEGSAREMGKVAVVPSSDTPPDEQAEAFALLLRACGESLQRAATYVNRANHTSYRTTTVGLATVEELNAAMEVVG